MAPQTRKRKAALDNHIRDQPPRKSSKVDDIVSHNRDTEKAAEEAYRSFIVNSDNDKKIECQKWHCETSEDEDTSLIFTHGAGGGLETPATKTFAEGYASKASIICFQGTMNLKSRLKSFQTVLNHLKAENPHREFAAGGRSMGARAAVMLANANSEVKRLVLVSYPLTSPKGVKRDEILLELPDDKEILFIIGSNDSMCSILELQDLQQKMNAKSLIRVIPDADHGMSLTKTPDSGTKLHGTELLRRASGEEAASWMLGKLKIENVSSLQVEQPSAVATAIDVEDPKLERNAKSRTKQHSS